MAPVNWWRPIWRTLRRWVYEDDRNEMKPEYDFRGGARGKYYVPVPMAPDRPAVRARAVVAEPAETEVVNTITWRIKPVTNEEAGALQKNQEVWVAMADGGRRPDFVMSTEQYPDGRWMVETRTCGWKEADQVFTQELVGPVEPEPPSGA